MVLLGPILSGPNYKQGGLINKGTSDWPEEDLWESQVADPEAKARSSDPWPLLPAGIALLLR